MEYTIPPPTAVVIRTYWNDSSQFAHSVDSVLKFTEYQESGFGSSDNVYVGYVNQMFGTLFVWREDGVWLADTDWGASVTVSGLRLGDTGRVEFAMPDGSDLVFQVVEHIYDPFSLIHWQYFAAFGFALSFVFEATRTLWIVGTYPLRRAKYTIDGRPDGPESII